MQDFLSGFWDFWAEGILEVERGFREGARWLSHGAGLQTGQPRLFGLAQHAKTAAGCPTAFEQGAQIDAPPEDGARHGPEAGKAAGPAAEVREVAQQHVAEEGRPELPAHGVGAVAEKVAELERLLDLAEKNFDLPAAAVELGHAAGRPLEVIGEKDQHAPLAVDLHFGFDPAQPRRVLLPAARSGKDDFVIALNAPRGPALPLFDDPVSSWRGSKST